MFESDKYTDLIGREWFCVADRKRGQMVCNSADGYFTCASFKTFAVWGWKQSPASRPNPRGVE